MISLDEISKILSCSSFKYKLNLTEIEKSNCCDVGDHFNGNIYRILVKGSVTINNEERDYRKSMIVKEITSDNFQSITAFNNEAFAYKRIIPLLKEVSKEQLPIRKCLGVSDNFIILPDLKEEGFLCWTKKNDFNYDETILVLKNLAKFHASSIVLKRKNKLAFEEIANNVKKFKFQPGSFLQLYQEMHLNMTMKILEGLDQNVAVVHAIKVIKKLLGRTYDMQKELFDKRRPIEVVTHGDLWCNNIMYDQVKKTILLIDLQLMICTSPAADLSYFLHNCLNVGTRKINYELFLKEYLIQLKTSLNEHGTDNVAYNYCWLKDEMDEFQLYGFMSTLWMLPIFYYEKDRFKANEKISDVLNEDYLLKCVNAEYKMRLIELVLDFTETFEFGGCASI